MSPQHRLPIAPRAAALAATLIASALPALGGPSLATNPTVPMYGQAVGVELRNDGYPSYLPALRYKRYGDSIMFEFEYTKTNVGATRADFGNLAVPLGELPPGNYIVQARVIDMARPEASEYIGGSIAVVPPQDWGIYAVPTEPLAFSESWATIRSAAYFDPATVRASVSGNVIRVDFDYLPDAPVGGPTPAGMTSYASVGLPALQPGAYVLEGWGRPKSGGESKRYFTRNIMVASAVPVVEFYSPQLDHYFMAASPEEIGELERGAKGPWMRTGQRFKAWARASDAPPTAQPVCRFYASSSNSHFFTGDAAECQLLRGLEAKQRADANAKGATFGGWQYEGVAFYALVPQNGACAPGTTSVYRAYNNRADKGDSNHRFTVEPALRAAMRVDWLDEGPAFCSPS